jgi:hypothetical protein
MLALRKSCLLAVCGWLLTASTAQADTIALTFTGGTLTQLGAPPGTVGWSFTVNAPITVT